MIRALLRARARFRAHARYEREQRRRARDEREGAVQINITGVTVAEARAIREFLSRLRDASPPPR